MDPALELKFKIDQVLHRCRADIDYCIMDFAQSFDPSQAKFLKPRTPLPQEPRIPHESIPEMLLPSAVPMEEMSDGSLAVMNSSSHHHRPTSPSRAKRVPADHIKVGRKSPGNAKKLKRPRSADSAMFSEEEDDDRQQPVLARGDAIALEPKRHIIAKHVEAAEADQNHPDDPFKDEHGLDKAALDHDAKDCHKSLFLQAEDFLQRGEDLKQRMRLTLEGDEEPFALSDLLHEEGWARTITLHPIFEYVTLTFIFINALWMGYDTDMNSATTLADADIEFVIMENVFCFYFLFEWLVRFSAFKRKCLCYKDRWFIFDTGLVCSAILETWVLSLIVVVTKLDLAGSKAFIVLRLARLTRLARMARLLRAAPQLLIMVKAIMVSMRTVIYALILLFVMVYVFAIACTQLMEGNTKEPGTAAHDFFRTVPMSMNTLLLSGALPDQQSLITQMQSESAVYYLMMLAFLFFASLTVMNMLIGILCDVISDVSATEKEGMLIADVKRDLQDLMVRADIFSDIEEQSFSRDAYDRLLLHPKSAIVFSNLDVDIFGLVDFADVIFATSHTVSFEAFMDTVMKLRGTNNATVKDIMELRKLVTKEIYEQSRKVERLLSNQNVLIKGMSKNLMRQVEEL
eukprot:TRINITY_DN6199_c0_g3_i1.p1 TRINITY_DN6199_c0_g3~~TRINITY_DN6199_c0_g3_i1.p1  ORF type:complete len:712 (+),score=132.57 TRINITY_DN6199_c0_g3_i1:250-2136(+)